MGNKPSNRLVRKAIREIMEPQIKALGFNGKYPEFRRTWERETHFIWFQTRKYGGGFNYQGAWCKRGKFNHCGKLLAEDEVEFVHTDFDDRASIERLAELGLMDGTMALRSIGDFDYEHIVEDEAACRELVKEAVALLPALDHWLTTREPVAGISCKGHRMRHGLSRRFLWLKALGQTGAFSLNAERPQTPQMDAQHAASLAPEYRLT